MDVSQPIPNYLSLSLSLTLTLSLNLTITEIYLFNKAAVVCSASIEQATVMSDVTPIICVK